MTWACSQIAKEPKAADGLDSLRRACVGDVLADLGGGLAWSHGPSLSTDILATVPLRLRRRSHVERAAAEMHSRKRPLGGNRYMTLTSSMFVSSVLNLLVCLVPVVRPDSSPRPPAPAPASPGRAARTWRAGCPAAPGTAKRVLEYGVRARVFYRNLREQTGENGFPQIYTGILVCSYRSLRKSPETSGSLQGNLI